MPLKAVRFEPASGLAGLPGEGRLLEGVEGGETAGHRFEPLAPLVQEVRGGRLRSSELRDRPLALLEPPARVLASAFELLDPVVEGPVVVRRGDGLALRGEPRPPRGGFAQPGPLVDERRFGRVGLAAVRLPPRPKRVVLHPRRGERPLRGEERPFGLGGVLASALQPLPLAAETPFQLPEPDPVGLRLALGLGQRLPAPDETRAELSAPAPELGDRFLGPTHLRPHLEGRPVALVVFVGGAPVRGPHPFEVRLDRPLPCTGRLERHLLRADRRAARLRLPLEGLPAKGHQLRSKAALLFLEGGIPLRLRGLPLETVELLVELVAQVGQPGEVLVRLAHPALGLAAAFAVQGDAGRLLEKAAQLLRPGLDEPRDRALLDDGVAAGGRGRCRERDRSRRAAGTGPRSGSRRTGLRG